MTLIDPSSPDTAKPYSNVPATPETPEQTATTESQTPATPAKQETPPAPEVQVPAKTEPEVFNSWADDAFDDIGKPGEEDPAEHPVTPPADAQDGNKPEDEVLPGETDEDAVARLIANHRGDSKSLAKAVLALKRTISKQGEELGRFRKGETPTTPAVPEATPPPAPIGAGTPQTPAPATPPVITEDQLPGYGITPDLVYDEATWNHDEESGWPLDANGKPVTPIDEWDIGFTPESRWDRRLEELEEEHGSAAVALKYYNREREAEQARVNAELNEKFLQVRSYQFEKAKPVEAETFRELATKYEEPVAKEMAQMIVQAAIKGYDELAYSGKLSKNQLKDPGIVQELVKQIGYSMYRRNDYETVAAEIRARLGSAAPAPQVQRGTTPAVGNTSAPPAPVVDGGKTYSAKTLAIAEKTGLTPQQVEDGNRESF